MSVCLSVCLSVSLSLYIYIYKCHCAHVRNVCNAHGPCTEGDMRQTGCFSPTRKMNGPNLRCDSGKSQEQNYRFQCKVYMHCVHCIYGHSGIDSKGKLYTFCTLYLRVLFTFHIYPNTISYQVASGQITWALKEHNLFFNSCGFYLWILHFLSFF